MRVLVTGATGFIAGKLIPELLRNNYDVICLVRDEEKARRLKDKYDSITCVFADVTKPETLVSLPLDIDYVVHMAAMGHVSATSQEAYELFTSINEGGTKNLIDYYMKSKTLKKFIHFSSTAAMGSATAPVMNEFSKPNPVTPYQKSKLRSELIPLEYYKEKQFPALILRPCMVYGIGGYGEFYKFCKLMSKGLFPKVGFGKNLTPLVHVDDVVKATLGALKNGRLGEVYIIASKQSIPMDKLRECVVKNTNARVPYIFVPSCFALAGAKLIELLFDAVGKEPIVTYRNIKSTITDRTFDVSKAEKELGYVPSVSFESGIQSTIDWYKKNNKL